MSLTLEQLEVVREFGRRVEAEPGLYFGRIMEQPDFLDSVVTVLSKAGAGETQNFGFEVSLREVLDQGVDVVLDVCLGRRPPRVLTHMTRIVGYFSTVDNWNRSKLAELADRRRGEYRLEGEKA